jgi:hypothetical protein
MQMKTQYRTTLLTAAAIALTACGTKPNAKAAQTPDSNHTANGEVAKGMTAPKPGTGNARSPNVLTGDTARAHLNPGRNSHDSVSFLSAIRRGVKMMPTWPAGPAPLEGALLPARRIVAFYGNPHEKKMGVLGEYPSDQMLAKLDQTVAEWKKADPSTPVQPALHLVTVVAQGAPGRDGMYRLRMDTSLINKVYGWAQTRKGLLFLDVQVGKSTVQAEIPRLLPYLSRPNVHLALDPEFSMHYEREGVVPSKKVGEMSAEDINYAIRTLTQLVIEKHLPPKVLVVHRWTRKMVSNASAIKPTPQVQVVMDMDGWGPPWLKFDSYRDYEVAEPVQFTGFKIFFHHDVKKGDALLTPSEVLRLVPRPIYIQYQ